MHDYSLAWNSNNPFDQIGYLHNETLDYFIMHLSNSILEQVSSEEFSSIFYNITSPFLSTNGCNQSKAVFTNITNAFLAIPNNYSSFNDFLLANSASEVLINKMDCLFEAIYSSNYNISTLCLSIKSLENQVASSIELTIEEKKIFFVGSAVAKFSGTYWFEEKQNPQSYWKHEFPIHDFPHMEAVGPITRTAVDMTATIAAFISGSGWGAFGVGSSVSASFVALDEALNRLYNSLGGRGNLTNFP